MTDSHTCKELCPNCHPEILKDSVHLDPGLFQTEFGMCRREFNHQVQTVVMDPGSRHVCLDCGSSWTRQLGGTIYNIRSQEGKLFQAKTAV